MTIYDHLFIGSLAACGWAAFFGGGDYREQRTWIGFLIYFCLIWGVFNGNPYSVIYNTIVCTIFAASMLKMSESRYGLFMAAQFALIGLAGAFVYLGLLSVEKGQGISGATYWNIKAVLLHGIFWTLFASSLFREKERPHKSLIDFLQGKKKCSKNGRIL